MAPLQGQSIKVFYCYAHEDHLLRAKLANHLRPLERESLITQWVDQDIQPGEEWASEIESQFKTAHIVLLLLSPDFIASDNCYDQLEKAFERHKKGTMYIVPILLRPMIWEDLPVSQLVHLPQGETGVKAAITWEHEDEAFANVAQSIRAIVRYILDPQGEHPPDTFYASYSERGYLDTPIERQSANNQAATKHSPRFQYIPIPQNRNFVGRKDLFGTLQKALHKQQRVALSGLGGLGKTQTALEYAYRYGKDYTTILWLSADSRETLQADARECTLLLNLLPPKKQETLFLLHALSETHVPLLQSLGRLGKAKSREQASVEIVDYWQLVKKWLEKSNDQWLVIFDNVEDTKLLRDILPRQRNGHVLLTTRLSVLGDLVKPIIPIEKVVPDEGANILLHRISMSMSAQTEPLKKENFAFAKRLSEMVDGLPLALDQAGAYIQETQISIKEYVTLYSDQARRVELLKYRGEDVSDHPESVATTFALSLEKIKEMNFVAALALQVCAFLHPDAIPDEVITKIFQQVTTIFKKISTLYEPEKLLPEEAETIKDLLRYSLLRRNPTSQTYTIHRLLQSVLKDTLPIDQQQRWAKLTISILNGLPVRFDETKQTTNEKRQRRSLAQLYLPHAQVCAIHVKTWDIQSAEAVELLNQAGAYLYQRRRYAEAQQLYEQLFHIKSQVQGASDLDRASVLRILANLTYLQKDKKKYIEAAQRYQEALRIYERELALDDPCIGQLLTHYAMLLRRLKRRKEAEALAGRAGDIWRNMDSQAKMRWVDDDRQRERWVGNLESKKIYALFGEWGLIYLTLIGMPIAFGWLFQSWAWGWGSFLSILLSITFSFSIWRLEDKRSNKGLRIVLGILFILLYCSMLIAAPVAGWTAGRIIFAPWSHTHWVVPLVCAIVSFFVVCVSLTDIQQLAEKDWVAIPKYTILPTFTFICSLCALPISLGLLLHSWWIFGVLLLGTWSLCGYLMIIWRKKRISRQKTLVALLFGGMWGYVGWMLGVFLGVAIHSTNWQQILPIALTLVAFSTGFFCHSAAYTQFSTMGSEGNLSFILEDLWVDFDLVTLLNTTGLLPIDDWGGIYSVKAKGHYEGKRYADAIASYNMAITNASFSLASASYRRKLALIYSDQHDYAQASTNYAQAIAEYTQTIADYNDLNTNSSAWAFLTSSAYNDRGDAYSDQHDYTRAIADYTQAIELDPGRATFYRNRSKAYAGQGDFARAKADSDQADDAQSLKSRANKSRKTQLTKEQETKLLKVFRPLVLISTFLAYGGPILWIILCVTRVINLSIDWEIVIGVALFLLMAGILALSSWYAQRRGLIELD